MLTIALNIAKLLVFIVIRRVRVIHINKTYGIPINKKVTHYGSKTPI